MFGYYNLPLRIVKEGISLSIEKEGEILVYRRECPGERIEKAILTSNGKILFNPVEPLNKPKEITSYLLIELERALVVEPKATRKIFLKFPVEIGVFMSKNKNFEILDILSLSRQKFTLYGDPESGVICKCWRSEVCSLIPSLNPLYEGVIELTIRNTTAEWIEITKAVFNAYEMKIYYDDKMVSMKANMKIMSKQIAETDFVDSPLKKGMNKSLGVYTTRKLPVVTTKFVMEWGL